MERPIFCKPEMARFAKAFASLVLSKPSASPYDVTRMTSTKAWKRASVYEREEIVQTIKKHAHGLLISAGFNPEIVHKNIPL